MPELILVKLLRIIHLLKRELLSVEYSYYSVGLGNPGGKYAETRHNVGHMFIEWIRQQENLKFVDKSYGRSFETPDAIFVQCPTFMNNSSKCLKSLENAIKVDTFYLA